MKLLTVVGWFPQQHADVFFAIKGVVAVISTIILLIHMSRSWYRLGSRAQRLRYLNLFVFAAVGSGGSLEQISESTIVSYRHLGALIAFLLLAVTSIISIRENNDRSALHHEGPGARSR